MDNFFGLHHLNDEDILAQHDNSDIEDLLDDDDDLDIDPTTNLTNISLAKTRNLMRLTKTTLL